MKKTTRTLTIVLMAIGIIVLAGCKKEENGNNDTQLGSSSVNMIGTVWVGGSNYSFEYEGERIDGYLSSRIAFIGENTAEFRLEGLPEETINRRVGVGEGFDTTYFDFDGNHVPFQATQRYPGRWGKMDVKLNSGVAHNYDPKTQALFDQYNNLIPIQLNYAGDTISF